MAGNPETVTDITGQWPWDNVVKAVTNVVKAAAPIVSQVVQAAAPVVSAVANSGVAQFVKGAADTVLGVSDMINDVKTLCDPNRSWQDKFGADKPKTNMYDFIYRLAL